MTSTYHEHSQGGEYSRQSSSRESKTLTVAARAIGLYEELLDGEDIPEQKTENPAKLQESLARLAALSTKLDKNPPLKSPKVLLDSFWIDLSFQPDRKALRFEIDDELDEATRRQLKIEAIVRAYQNHPDLGRAAKDFRIENKDAFKNRDDKFGKYIAYARAHRRPSSDEELELWGYIEAGVDAFDSSDDLSHEANEAMTKLAFAQRILHVTHMRNVVFVVMKETTRHTYDFNNELLAVEGNIALINTINGFNTRQGSRLGKAAEKSIRAAVVSYLAGDKTRKSVETPSEVVSRSKRKQSTSNTSLDLEAKIRGAFGSTPKKGPKSHDANFSTRDGRHHGKR